MAGKSENANFGRFEIITFYLKCKAAILKKLIDDVDPLRYDLNKNQPAKPKPLLVVSRYPVSNFPDGNKSI